MYVGWHAVDATMLASVPKYRLYGKLILLDKMPFMLCLVVHCRSTTSKRKREKEQSMFWSDVFIELWKICKTLL